MKINAISYNRQRTFLNFAKRTSIQPNREHGILGDFFAQTGGNPNSITRREKQTFKNLSNNFTPQAKGIYDLAADIATSSCSREIETCHFYYAALLALKKYFDQVDKKEIDPIEETLYVTAEVLPTLIYSGCDLWNNSEMQKEIKGVVDKHIKIMQDNFNMPKGEQIRTIKRRSISPSANAIIDMTNVYKKTNNPKNPTSEFFDDCWLTMPLFSSDKKIKDEAIAFISDMQNAAMTKPAIESSKYHIGFYDRQADAIWRNIAHGNNVFVLNNADNEVSARYLERSFVNLINKPGQKYGSLQSDKTDVILLNDNARIGFIADLVKDIKKDETKKGRTTVIVGDFLKIVKNSEGTIYTNELNLLKGEKAKNSDQADIRFVFYVTPETYQVNAKSGAYMESLFQSYSLQQLPLLNAKDAKKYLANESGLEYIKQLAQKDVTKEAVNRAIELTSSTKGNYPEKALDLIMSSVRHFANAEQILPEHIEAHLKEMNSLSLKADTEKMSIIFDTGKRLDDIKGMPMTKKQAQSIVNQIKNKTIGTCGYIVSHNYGGAQAGGRSHTVYAIAGEAGVPVIEIDGIDFGTKDIDAISQQPGFPEQKIKKIFQEARAQAEANDLDACMIFIKNFDRFGSNPLYGISSIYEQQAFVQLQAEMNAAQKEGKYNIVVMGSMNMPETIDENIRKPGEFLEDLIIYQPQDALQVREVLEYYIEKNGYKIADTYKGQKEEILKNISETVRYFNVVYLMHLLKKADVISKERKKEAIDGTDFTEAYLQLISGKVNNRQISDDRKKVVTSHEAGHALVLQVMGEILKKRGEPWHLPNEVDFITLDPRGDFGGAMFNKKSQNDEFSFEVLLSEIVCDYGGYSAQSSLYNIEGSWGIKSDMQMATEAAEEAVMVMGMGKSTGVRNLYDAEVVSFEQGERAAGDVQRILNTAKSISDLIVKEYVEFIEEFTEKYYKKVGTGECIIPASQFISELNAWREKQDSFKKKKLKWLEDLVIIKIKLCK